MNTYNIPYGRQEITEEDIEAVKESLKSDFLTQGPKVKEFEEKFAAYVGADFAVAVSNGTAALHLCALALGVNEKSKVITTPITFAASANCIRYCGGEVYFSDIDPESYTLDIQKVENILKSNRRGTFQGIIPVDFAGYPVNMEAFRKLADDYNLWIIEDACHAPGAYFSNSESKKIKAGSGTYADLAIFSFHPVKHIACGEGGMITTNNKDLYEKLLLLRSHGITKDPEKLTENHGGWYYEMQTLGYNYRIPDINCALGISQLKRADRGLAKRQKIAQRYFDELKTLPVKLPQIKPSVHHAFHLFVIQTEKRKALYDYLKAKGIYTQVHYIPVHTMPYYKKLGLQYEPLPIAESYYEKCLSLPMYPSITDAELDYVIHAIKSFFNE
jgi:UDP-4-amino-4,6-dideoxy-N-acetyl-beta-L-altrosamine transaminase